MSRLALCAVDDIEDGGSKGFTLDKFTSVFAVRRGEAVYVYRNTCPHAGFELNWTPDKFLDRNREHIMCSAHGALFEITTGHCFAGPCTGSRLSPVGYIVEDGLIYLSAEQGG